MNQTLHLIYNATYCKKEFCNSSMALNSSMGINGTWNNSNFIIGIPSDQLDPGTIYFRKMIRTMDLYLVPIIAIAGIVGNIVSFLVFISTYMRNMSTSIYLAGLALSDTGFLIGVLVSWSVNVKINIYNQNGWCQTFVYLTYVSSFLSVWYVVAFTVERFIAVRYPFKRQEMCTPRRAKIVLVSFAVIACLVYNFAIWTSAVRTVYERPFCSIYHQYFDLVSGLNNADTLITLIIPTFIIVTCNIKITYAVTYFYRETKNQEVGLKETYGPRYSRSQLTRSGENNFNKAHMKITKLLLIVSTVFLFCNIPSHGIRVYAFFRHLVDKDYVPSAKFRLWQKLFLHVYYINFAVNFLLYSLSGKTFRRALGHLWQKIKQKTCLIVTRRQQSSFRSKHSTRRTDLRQCSRQTPGVVELEMQTPINVNGETNKVEV